MSVDAFFFLLDLVLDLNANVALAPSLVRWSSDIVPLIFWGNVISGPDSCACTLCCGPAGVATDEKHLLSHPRVGGPDYVGWLCCLRCFALWVGVGGVVFFSSSFSPPFSMRISAPNPRSPPLGNPM